MEGDTKSLGPGVLRKMAPDENPLAEIDAMVLERFVEEQREMIIQELNERMLPERLM